jgi:hypothetical protein
VKQQHTEEIDRRQSRLADRLSRSSRPQSDSPMLAGGNEVFEVAQRVKATNHGGIGLIHRMVRQLGLVELTDS